MQSVHEGIHFNCDKRVKEEISLVINEITRQQKGITVKYIYAITSSRKTFFCNHCDYNSIIFPSWNNFLLTEWLSLTIDLWTHLLQIKCLLDEVTAYISCIVVPICCLVISLITRIMSYFMQQLPMSIMTIVKCWLVITFITSKMYSFMIWLYMYSRITFNSLSHWSQLKCIPSWTDFVCTGHRKLFHKGIFWKFICTLIIGMINQCFFIISVHHFLEINT